MLSWKTIIKFEIVKVELTGEFDYINSSFEDC